MYYRIATNHMKLFKDLSKCEYRAFVFLLLNPEFMELNLDIEEFLNKLDMNIKKLETDIYKGIDLLIHKGILKTSKSKGYNFNKEIIDYEDYNPNYLSSSRSYVKIYRTSELDYMLKNFSCLDFKLMFKIIDEIDYFTYCENKITILKSKQEKWAKEFNVSVHSVKKSLMKLKHSNFMTNSPGKNICDKSLKYTKSKFIVNTNFVYKGSESERLNKHLTMKKYNEMNYKSLSKELDSLTIRVKHVFERLNQIDPIKMLNTRDNLIEDLKSISKCNLKFKELNLHNSPPILREEKELKNKSNDCRVILELEDELID